MTKHSSGLLPGGLATNSLSEMVVATTALPSGREYLPFRRCGKCGETEMWKIGGVMRCQNRHCGDIAVSEEEVGD